MTQTPAPAEAMEHAHEELLARLAKPFSSLPSDHGMTLEAQIWRAENLHRSAAATIRSLAATLKEARNDRELALLEVGKLAEKFLASDAARQQAEQRAQDLDSALNDVASQLVEANTLLAQAEQRAESAEATVAAMREALTTADEFMVYISECENRDVVPICGDKFHEHWAAIKAALSRQGAQSPPPSSAQEK